MRTVVMLMLSWFALAGAGFAQGMLNASQDLVRLGIASSNMEPNRPSLDAGPLFLRAVNYANSHPISRVIVDPGAYYFNSLQNTSSHVTLAQIKDLTIDLQGSDLYFSFPLLTGIIVTHATNVVVQNFTTDYDPLPFTQVRVTSVDPVQRRFRFAVDGNWQNPSVLNAAYSAINGSIEVHFFRNGRPITNVARLYAVNPVGSDEFTVGSDPGNYSNSAVLALIKPGDIAFLGMRTGRDGAIRVTYCTGCTFRNIRSYSSVEYGIGSFVTDSSVFERTYSMPRPGTDRLASTYGQLEFGAMGPGNQFRLNRMIATMDNALIEIADFLGSVKSQTNARTFVVEGIPGMRLSLGLLPPPGTAVSFQRPSDGAILASAVIVSQDAPPFTNQNPYPVTFTFDRDLPASIVGAVMYGTSDDLRAGRTLIERNALEESTDCCRGFLLGGIGNSSIRGNYIQRSPMSALQLENSMFTAELTPPVANLTISNNVIDKANWTATGFPAFQLGGIEIQSMQSNFSIIRTTAHQNIALTGNFVADSGGPGLWLGNTSGASVTGNYFIDSGRNPVVQAATANFGTSTPVVVQLSDNVSTANNVVDPTWRRMWVTDRDYRELAAYAPESAIRLNAHGIGSLIPTPSVTLTDADGNVTPLPMAASSAHAIDLQIPASASLGGAYLTLTSGSVKYFGTLFLDGIDNIPALNGCTYEVSPAASVVGASAGVLPVLVVTQVGCGYQVSATDSWVSAGASGSGPSVVSIAFSAKPAADRTSTVEIGGQQFTMTQTTLSEPAGSTRLVFPQFAFGGGWYSAIYFSNTGTSPVSFSVSFIDDTGAPLMVPSVSGSSVVVNLSGRGTAVIEAPNAGSLKQGYVSMSLPPGVAGYGVFRQSLPGIPDQEAVCPLSSASSMTSTLVWDETNVSTAVAILNPSSVPVTVTITVWDSAGSVIGTSSVNLSANNKTEFFLRTLPGLAAMAGKRGSAQFAVSTGNLAVLGLRFGAAAFTSIPTTQ